MDILANISVIIGVLVVLVNLLTQVIKKATWDKLPTNLVVLILSVGLTVGAWFAYAAVYSQITTWYIVAGAVIVGFLVAYAAMFGYDKLKEALVGLQNIRAIKDNYKGGGGTV